MALPGQSGTHLGFLSGRPAVLAAILLIAGILLHDHVPYHPIRLWIFIGAWTIVSAGFLRFRRLGTFALALLIPLLGIALAQREHFKFAANDIALFATDEPHLAELEVQFIDDPQVTIGPSEGRPMPPRQTAMVDLLKIKTHDGWTSAIGRLPVQFDELNPQIRAGQIVRMLGMLQRPRAAMNPGEFDWAAYYRQQRILACFTVRRAGNLHILSDPGPGVMTWLRDKTHHLLGMGFTQKHAEECALLDALVLGHRDPELRDIQDEFKATGTAYQLNVSGLHIALLAGVVYWICRWFMLRPRITLAITSAFVLLYASISLPSHSGIRAAIFCIVIAFGALGGRGTDGRQSIALAVIAMLLWHPMDLYSVGFQLSFVVAVGFLLIAPAFQAWLQSLTHPDEAAKPKPHDPTTFQRVRTTVFAWLRLGLIAWVVTLPLIARDFGQVPIWSVLINVVMFPVVAIGLFGGVLKILLTLLWPPFAGMFALVAGWPMHVVRWSVHELAKLPASSAKLEAPSLILIILYYALLAAPLLPYRFGLTGRRRWALRLAPALALLLLFVPLAHPAPALIDDSVRITLLSIGAGQCGVVELPGHRAIMIDAGSSTVSDVAQKVVEPYLRSEKVTHLDEIFLSHGDFDHISAAGELLPAFRTHDVFTSHHFRRNAAGNVPDLMLLDELEKLNQPPRQIARGDHVDLGGGAGIDVLWPPADGDLNSNNAGLVLKLTYAGRSVLFPADIQDPAFIGVLKNPNTLKSDVLVAPHHGSSEDLTPAFLAAVKPQMILSSNFWRLASKQRRFETMVGQTPLYRTPECGAITITIGRDGSLALGTFRKVAKGK